MSKYSSHVIWSDEDGGFIATCPEFPNLSGFGEAPEQALLELGKAVDLAVGTYEAEGWTLPEPRERPEHSGQFRLRLPKRLHAWLAEEAQREGVSLNTLVVTRLAQEHGGALELERTHTAREGLVAVAGFTARSVGWGKVAGVQCQKDSAVNSLLLVGEKTPDQHLKSSRSDHTWQIALRRDRPPCSKERDKVASWQR